MTLLAIETSCDETSAAVIREGEILSNIVSSQTAIHAEYGGVVPELATREHLRNLIPVIQAALRKANVDPPMLDAVAATRGPGLPSALLVGLKAGQALAFSLRKPVIGIHHHEAHLYSPWISGDPPRAYFARFEPSVSLIVSGGHTLLVAVTEMFNHRVLGGTLDDAAGECFDKTGKLMGLAYPAGPEIDRLAAAGNPRTHNFPRPMLNEPGEDFSFAGLKTSVRYFLQKNPGLLEDPRHVRDLCASVQAAIVEVLVAKTVRAARRLGVQCVTASGGVACNTALRRDLEAACKESGLRLRLADRQFSTDNAAMIGILAEQKLLAGAGEIAFDAEIEPSWAL
ncbi:MAG TPA: tRNA (adenosine(37)-N6)-threonylcarbamoyltransferase complex transferase subunit TsaD [Candidatus Saccharimonadales bacterium]|nr:tRNA (adenosine(37)-N6)-threonylcarbamoyltransferase complex transferase subunit TsaD [Candidatus Saccharimonadales bacterium]